jgi:hypothetical protein
VKSKGMHIDYGVLLMKKSIYDSSSQMTTSIGKNFKAAAILLYRSPNSLSY